MGSGRALALIAIAATAAHAEDAKASAKKALDRAKEHHKAGKFDEALKELTLAYALDPQSELLYGIAQLHVKIGQCPEAIQFYRRYLATKPNADATAKAQQAIENCEKTPTTVAPPEPPKPEPPKPEPPKPKPEPPKPEPTVIVVKREAKPWYKDPIGDALVIGGVVVGTVGLFMYRSAVSTRDAADDVATYPEYVDALEDARSKRTYALVLGLAGVALIGGGVVRYATRSTEETESRVTVVPTGDGGLVTWGGRF